MIALISPPFFAWPGLLGNGFFPLPYLADELGAGLEGGNHVGGDQNGRVPGHVTGHFCRPMFDIEAPELADVNGFAFAQGVLHDLKKGFDHGPANRWIKLGQCTDSVNYVLLCHACLKPVLRENL